MSGHSKWNNIKRKKEKADGAKAKIFTKIGRELAVAVKEGGSADPAANSRLRDAIAKAKAANVPNDNIDRIIKKAAGEGNNDNFENVTYEGYGPSGVAVIVEALPTTGTAPPPMCATLSTSLAATWAPPAACPSCSTRRASSPSSGKAWTRTP